MKKSMRIYLYCMALLGLMIAAEVAQAKDLNSDLNSLGTNQQVVTRAKRLDPKNKVSIVQNRLVDRNMRLEVGGLFGGVANGDSYTSTMDYGAQADFHIIPEFSLGARYIKSANSLTADGQQMVNTYNAGQGSLAKIDNPESQILATATWYMLYGKINMFDLGVTQFDIYSVIGGGQMKTELGSSPTLTGGAGVAFWWSQHVSSRLEIRYQTYEDQAEQGGRRLNTIVGTAGIGFLI